MDLGWTNRDRHLFEVLLVLGLVVIRGVLLWTVLFSWSFSDASVILRVGLFVELMVSGVAEPIGACFQVIWHF